MITPKRDPLRVAVATDDASKQVLVYKDEEEHTTAFGYEWSTYPRVQTDSTLRANLSLSRLELNLGFPATFLKGMNVLELGAGPGRFTEHFATYAKSVVAVDLSDAIYHNAGVGKPNVVALKADLMDVPEFSEPFDLVFCRGVIQHTVSPKESITRLFDYVRPGGLVIFDVYKKLKGDERKFKYFWRPFFKKRIPLANFGAYLKRNGEWLYDTHHQWLHFLNTVSPLRWVMEHTPNSEEVLRALVTKCTKAVFFSVPNTGFFRHRLRLLFGKAPAQWVHMPNEHLRFWTIRDMRWWLRALGYTKCTIIPYHGIPGLNHLMPNLFAEGMVVSVEKQP